MSTSITTLVTPVQILADAKDLASALVSPARQRTVISRAYYAAYHACIDRFPAPYDKDQQGGMHRQFLRALRSSSDPLARACGDRLNGLYGRRLLADYQLGGIITRQMAIDAIEDAEEIVHDLLGLELPAAKGADP